MMKKVLIFLTGVSIGAGATYVLQKKKYEEQINEEFREAREYRRSNENKEETTAEDRGSMKEPDNESEEEDIEEVNSIIKEMHYDRVDASEQDIINKYKKPYVVSPEDFASISGFDTDTFYYHPNGVISNDNNEEVEDVEQYLGMSVDEVKDQFGVYEDDSVFIRNMRLKTDYEILREEEDYLKRNGD